ncbi:M15 family metallopeptidase [Pseudonocardia parietis]|uniref:Peptidase M15C domain-containing protein n=1 Tax=Pseudonocardia parietis TaxID=570936 RepID=A0ABS4W1X1_9PSEU|nr:M15 family metallopeptidase [Pseudonocardia parietis]MBP2370199.1 hypothetical protein [Pseudonocardia parietis]
MASSQNGYPAGDRSLIHNPRVPGTSITFPGGLRRGPTGDLLLWVAAQLHHRVEDGGTGYGMWGYAYRAIRGATSLSNHASGTAIDWHAPRHPLGKSGTFNAAQVREIRKILAEAGGCIRWGGDYTGRKDEMHFEAVASEAACARALAAVSGSTTPEQPARPATPGDDLVILDKTFLAVGHNDFRLTVPVGTASAAWGLSTAVLSIVGNGPVTGTVYVQDDKRGIVNWPIKVTNAGGICARFWDYLPNGTTQLGIVLDAPNGGTVTIEGKAK